MAEKFDVIIVGAGCAGSAAAVYLARKGFDTLLLEKAKIPGHRNMTGGVLFGNFTGNYDIAHLIPDFEEEAPLERKIIEHTVHIISNPRRKDGESSYKIFTISKDTLMGRLGVFYYDPSTGRDYSVLRGTFDKWFMEKAIKAGAMVATEVTAEEAIMRDGMVVGVRTPQEELGADLVIDASGVTSTLVEQVGLSNALEPSQVYHGVKHVYRLDEKTINERFGVQSGEGKALLFFGEFMKGIIGGAFLYTNKETVSSGIVVSLDSALKKCVENPDIIGKPLDLLEEFEYHPMIAKLLEGGTMVEYSAHNIPKGSKSVLKKPFTSGLLVTGDAMGAFTKIGPMIDGMRRAIASGMMAAETYEKARTQGDFSEKTLSIYASLLKPIYRDIARYRFDSLISESRFAYNMFPKFVFGMTPFPTKVIAKDGMKTPDVRDGIQRIQERTGLLDYDEDKQYSHIKVDYDACAKSETKSWVPGCPYNCYTLVLDKGVFASFKDLYVYNLGQLSPSGNLDNRTKRLALERTREDVRRGVVRFDHVACVGCGTCGVIGPRGVIVFGHERFGHGVKYRYG